MPRGLYDVYEAVDDLVIRLHADGMDQWAEPLRDAMHGSTSGEILALLGSSLTKMLKSNEVGGRARASGAEILADIDRFLGPAER